ncbi:MAG: hypothetical protein WBP61_03255 [Nocardioides sp.]
MPRVTSTTLRAASAALLVAALGLGAGPDPGAAHAIPADPPERSAVRTHLLDPERLPALAGREWKVRPGLGHSDAAAVGACQKTPLNTLGAVATGHRHFTAGRGIRATQVVARFVDPRSAWRAHQVLRAWRADCEERVTHVAVGPLEPVYVRTGTADTYRASYPRSGAAGIAMHRSGAYLTIVEVTATPPRYPASWDPVRKAVRRIARTF